MKNSQVYSRKISRVWTVKATPELITSHLACEQVLRGAPAAVREKEGELATTSLEFEYLHRKSRCDMLIGADWRKSDSTVDGEPQGNWRWNWNSRDEVASSPSFSLPAARAPQSTFSQASSHLKWPTKQNYCEVTNSKHFCFYSTKKHFILERYFPKTREIGSLVVRPWES